MSDEQARGSILVVDDTPANLKLLSDLLKRQNYVVRAARSGPVALMSARSNPPELVLLDVSMPDMDGYEVARQLKSTEDTRDIPIIFTSALNETDDMVRAFEVGGADYITKPFKFKEVLARVENHLTLARQRREIEKLREREKQRFEMLNQLRNQFVGGATHDLKNPLAAVQGNLLMIERQKDPINSENTQHYVTQIRRSIEKMQSLLSDMLDYLRIETQHVLNNLEPVQLQTYLPKIVADFEMQARENQVTLAIEIAPETPAVDLDKRQFARVVENLVSNALKYTPQQGEIRVVAYAEDEIVCIEVHDTGMGIPEDAMDNLFKPFFRVKSKEHNKIAGTGLGLSVVKAIVEQHGGTVTASSVEGEGTTFQIHLPS